MILVRKLNFSWSVLHQYQDTILAESNEAKDYEKHNARRIPTVVICTAIPRPTETVERQNIKRRKMCNIARRLEWNAVTERGISCMHNTLGRTECVFKQIR